MPTRCGARTRSTARWRTSSSRGFRRASGRFGARRPCTAARTGRRSGARWCRSCCGRAPSRRQARRIWDAGADGYAAVAVGGKTRYVLEEDLGSLFCAPEAPGRLLLLGAHDPYLDVRDRDVLLESPSLQKQVWKTVGNPGAVLKDGRVVGVWRGKARNGRLDVTISPFEALTPPERLALEGLAAEYADFRGLALHGFGIGGLP
ncbi:DNA glycosylase AlkZ-like family protein [Intestinibacillus massiliensis]|uniref:DNA glycosylase AlkZ-like family protein n=1 Tax=Intestinibacillus massiliensis TaxID=1871029 RepID=UPI0038B3E3F0